MLLFHGFLFYLILTIKPSTIHIVTNISIVPHDSVDEMLAWNSTKVYHPAVAVPAITTDTVSNSECAVIVLLDVELVVGLGLLGHVKEGLEGGDGRHGFLQFGV